MDPYQGLYKESGGWNKVSRTHGKIEACLYRAVSSPCDRSMHFTLHPLADMFFLSPTRQRQGTKNHTITKYVYKDGGDIEMQMQYSLQFAL